MENLKRVCAYARVSTGREAQALSLENQTAHYERLIKSNPQYEFVGVFADRGLTGTNENRPEFQRMIEECRKGRIDLIYTKSISRFARNTVTVIKYARELKGLGVGIFFEEHNINTLSSAGELMLTVLAAFAQEESRSLSENIKWALRKQFEQGRIVINTTYFLGYDLNKEGQLIINKEQAALVKRIFEMYLSGMGSTAIAKALNDEGIITLRGKQWNGWSIRCILKNEKYKGDYKMQKYCNYELHRTRLNRGDVTSYYIENDHEAIVSKEDWEKAQAIMAKRAERKQTQRYPLSGMLKCPYCGTSLRRYVNAKGEIEWWCGEYRKKGKKGCRGIRISEEEVSKQKITEPTVVKEEFRNGKKYYSYTGLSKYVCKEEKQNTQNENGGILPSVHRQRRTAIKL